MATAQALSVIGVITNNILDGSTIESTISLYDNITTGPITFGSNSTGNITFGGTSTTINIPGSIVLDDIIGTTPTTNVSLINTTTTGQIDIGTLSTGTFNLGGLSTSISITGDLTVPIPASNTSVINRGFVNSKTHKDAVRATTGSNGVLASSFEDGDTIPGDDVVLATGDRILIKNQDTGTENGIYIVNATGAPTRTNDAIIGMKATGASMIIEEGTTNSNKLFFCNTDNSDFGDTITFTQLSSESSSTSSCSYLSDVQAGIEHGGIFIQDIWTPRHLNTVQNFGSLTIASPTIDVARTSPWASPYEGGESSFILPAGSYLVFAGALAYRVSGHQIRLYDVTNATVLINGEHSHNVSTGAASTRATITGVTITVATDVTCELQHICTQSYASQWGRGVGCGASTSIFAHIAFYKL